jgi:SAM-dependent methyltransferase
VQDLPQISAAIGHQFAELARALAARSDAYRPAAPGELAPPFGNLELSDWVRAMQLWREHGAPLVHGQPSRPCPACGADTHRPLFDSFDFYPYVDCLACGTWYVPLIVDEAMFERYYDACPEARAIMERLAAQRLDAPKADADRIRMSAYFGELEALLPPERRDLLDVGCGVGHSLELAASRGWRATGIDSSPSLIRAGRSRGLEIFHPDEPLGRSGFGLITLWETLEHINDPFALLSGLVPRLGDDGLMSITVPNVRAIEARVMRQDLSWINGGAFGTVHVNLFHKTSLEHLLSRVGLEVVGVDGEFGLNTYELASYVLGGHRGAWDYARGYRVDRNLSEDAVCFLNWVGPAWFVLARQLLLTPILKVVAAKSGTGVSLDAIRARYAEDRRAEMLADLDRSYPAAPGA